jgi:hypothetical protein
MVGILRGPAAQALRSTVRKANAAARAPQTFLLLDESKPFKIGTTLRGVGSDDPIDARRADQMRDRSEFIVREVW